jgi:hypothetical protein
MIMRKTAWLIVVGIALLLSNWSLAYVGRSWGVPWQLAVGVSAVFDGVALLCADLALTAARRGDSTFGPSAFLLAFGGASAYFNGYHAILAGLPLAAEVFFAVPPVAALVAVELQLRSDRRQALREAGRIADPLPAFGGATWLNMPYPAWKAQRSVMKHRLTAKLRGATGQRDQRPQADGQPVAAGSGSRAAAPGAGSKRASAPGLQLAEQRIATALKDGQTLSKRTAAETLGLDGVSEYQVQGMLSRQRALLNGH